LRTAVLREISFSWRRRMRSSARSMTKSSRFRGREPVLGLALEFRLADEYRYHAGGAGHHVVGGYRGRALALARALGVVLDALDQRTAQAGFVRAAVRRRDRVAIGRQETVGIARPRHRPLRPAVHADLAGGAVEDVRMDQCRAVDRGGEIFLEAVGEMERGLFRHVLDALQELLGASPADLDAAEQVGLGARHLEDALRLEMRLGAEDVGIGQEADLGAAPVGGGAELLQLAFRLAALEHHAVERLLARDLHLQARGQGVRDRDAHAVQAARGAVDLRVKLAARVQRAHDHFERGFLGKFRVRIDGNATAIVCDSYVTVGLHLDLDEGGVPIQGLVHGIVDHLGKQVMQRLFVGAADVHARTAAHRLEALEHLDVLGVVVAVAAARGLGGARGLAGEAARRGLRQVREQVAAFAGFLGRRFGGLSHRLWARCVCQERGGTSNQLLLCHALVYS
jgi:hypothetical protein